MFHLFHRYKQTILIAMTVVIIATFILFWNGRILSEGFIGGPDKVATIYGRSITQTEIQQDVRKFQIAGALGLNDLMQALAGNADTQEQAVENWVWNSYVFDHEADALGVYPTDAEVQDELGRVPGFQTDGHLDPQKLTDFVQNKLPPLGFSDTVIDDLVRQQVRVHQVMKLIGSTVALSQAELENRFMAGNEKMNISVIRLNTSDLEKSINISDADALKTYNARKDMYASEEQRQVGIASFELTDAQKALKGKDRTDALQILSDKAWSFDQAVVEKGSDFKGQVANYGAKLSSSAFFTAAAPDPALTYIPTLANNAFKLSSDYPTSDVLEGSNGYYVLHLQGTVPSRALSFEEAKPKIVADMQKDRAAQLLQTRANEIRNAVLLGMKAGNTFAVAAAGAGVTAESVPAFSLAEASKLDMPDAQSVIPNAIPLSDGQMSDFVPTDAGGLFVYMNGHEEVPAADAALGEQMVKDQFTQQKQAGAFLEWLRLRKEGARLQMVQASS
jgi:hypothetical protein